MAKYCTYITVHESNGLFYIGKALLKNVLTRGYKGSGTNIRKALKEYPREQWKTEVLWVFDSSDEAYSDEAAIVTKEVLSDPLCLNKCMGGGRNVGGNIWTEDQRTKQSDVQKIVQNKPEVKQFRNAKIKEALSNKSTRKKLSAQMKRIWAERREAKNDNI